MSRSVPTDEITLGSLGIWRLSVDQYHAMIKTGILTDDDPVELLQGWLVAKMPKNPPHRLVNRLIRSYLESIIPVGWYVDSQEPITLGGSEPEPDVTLVRGQTRDYLDRHPGPADLALVVEVSDTTLERDRTLKQITYSGAAIPIYWIVNLPERQIEVYRDPGPKGYQSCEIYSEGDEISVSVEGEMRGRVVVKDLLP